MDMGLELLKLCDEVWVFGDKISEGMKKEIEFAKSLPKTRSGKIMRRVLKAKELGLSVGDVSTLEEY